MANTLHSACLLLLDARGRPSHEAQAPFSPHSVPCVRAVPVQDCGGEYVGNQFARNRGASVAAVSASTDVDLASLEADNVLDQPLKML